MARNPDAPMAGAPRGRVARAPIIAVAVFVLGGLVGYVLGYVARDQGIGIPSSEQAQPRAEGPEGSAQPTTSGVPLPSPTGEIRSKPAPGGKMKFFPASAEVEQRVPYAFTVGHCGLSYLTDFDGSFWDPVVGKGEGPAFLINSDQGTMTLVSETAAIYRSSSGKRVRLVRHDGPFLTTPCG